MLSSTRNGLSALARAAWNAIGDRLLELARAAWTATALLLSLAIVAGVWLGATAALSYLALLLAVVLGLTLTALGRGRRLLWLPALLFVALAIGLWRAEATRLPDGPGGLTYYLNRDVTIAGTVAADPELLDRSANVRIDVESLTAGGVTRRVSGGVQVRVNAYTTIAYGDRLTLSGTLSAPADLPGSSPGSYRRYLAAQGVEAVLYYPRIQHLLAEAGNLFETIGGAIHTLTSALRRWLEGGLRRALPQPEVALLIGILLGGRTRSLGALTASFVATGMIRLIAIDGFKVSLVVGTIDALLRRRLGPRHALLGTLPALALYVLVTGATPAGLRSGLMWALALLALRVGRRSDAVTSLGLAAAFLSLWSPRILGDVGFQLSLSGTAGIIVLRPGFERLLHRLPAIVGETLATSLAAQVGTLPVLASGFGQLSLVSLLANVALLPLLGPIMVLGVPAALAGAVVPFLGWFLGLLVYPLLYAMILGVGLLARLPASPSDAWPTFAIAGYYVLVGIGAWLLIRQARPALPRLRALSLPAMFAMCILLLDVAVVRQMPGRDYALSALNLGGGQALLLTTPGGRTVLIDGGDRPSLLAAALGERLPFWRSSLDDVISSSTDTAHIAGLSGLVQHYAVTRVLDPGAVYPGADYALWRAELRGAGIAERKLRTGARYSLDDGCALDVLLPAGLNPDEPEAPVALRLHMGRVSMLALNRTALDGFDPAALHIGARHDAILVLPSGGSDPSTYAEAVRTIHPQIVILPSADDKRDGAGSDRATMRAARAIGARIWQTGDGGSLNLTSDGTTLHVGSAS